MGLDSCPVDKSRVLDEAVLGLVAVVVAAGRVGVDILDTETIVVAGPVGRMTAAVATWLFGT